MSEISVIVPVYNTEKYLHRCIDSILAQTFTDFELILVDDGSSDNSPKICDEYAEKDCRVKVIHQENGGVSKARNVGIDNSCGTYLMFCDSDDYVDRNWCLLLYDTIEKNPKNCVVCNGWRESIDGADRYPIVSHVNELYSGKTYFDIYKMRISGSACLQIFKRSTVIMKNLLFEVGIPIGEDAAFCARYARCCEGFIYISTPLYYYIFNPESAVNKYYWNALELHLPLFLARLPLIEHKNLAEFSDIHFAYFVGLLDVVFDKRNKMTYFGKMDYNNRMVRSEAFQTCINCMSGARENPIVIKLLKTRSYYLYWLFKQLVKIKQKLKGKHKS